MQNEQHWFWAAIGIAIAIVFSIVSIDFGLAPVETANWGGFLVTLVIAVTGIVASLPLGIVLALGRRSKMPVIRLVSIIFIEFWRGVSTDYGSVHVFGRIAALPSRRGQFRQAAARLDRCSSLLGSLYGRSGSRRPSGYSKRSV